MDKNTARIINVVLIIFICAFVVIEFNWFRAQMRKPMPAAPPVEEEIGERVEYTVVEEEKKRPASDFERMFEENPKEDVGGNIVEAWRNVPKETAAKLSGDLDDNIEKLEKELRRNPDNKKARHKLKVTKLMKKLAESDFDASKMKGD
jgi:hypothetical protein